jgi:hypothetical protein
MLTPRFVLQSLPVGRSGAPLCIVPSLPAARLGTVSPYRDTDVFVLDVDNFVVRSSPQGIVSTACTDSIWQAVACFKAHNNGIAALQLSHDGRSAQHA